MFVRDNIVLAEHRQRSILDLYLKLSSEVALTGRRISKERLERIFADSELIIDFYIKHIKAEVMTLYERLKLIGSKSD